MNVKTDFFEGPLDLLCHLIEKNEIDIYDIPIALLADQYIDYIKTFPERDMNSMSEFILMASTLLEIKSKMLLPKSVQEEEDEGDPRDELVRRLIEYKKFRGIIGTFREKENDASLIYFKNYDSTLPLADFHLAMHKNAPAEVLDGITLDVLYSAFKEVLKRRELKTDHVRQGFSAVYRDLYTVEEKAEYIRNMLRLNTSIKFDSIFLSDSSRMEIVVTFLALLELIKISTAFVHQSSLFGEILISSNKGEN